MGGGQSPTTGGGLTFSPEAVQIQLKVDENVYFNYLCLLFVLCSHGRHRRKRRPFQQLFSKKVFVRQEILQTGSGLQSKH